MKRKNIKKFNPEKNLERKKNTLKSKNLIFRKKDVFIFEEILGYH